jgi:hypothetical protein
LNEVKRNKRHEGEIMSEAGLTITERRGGQYLVDAPATREIEPPGQKEDDRSMEISPEPSDSKKGKK